MGSSFKNLFLVLTDGIRLSGTSTLHRFFPAKKYSGSIEQMCRDIIDDCFDKKKKYFRVSPHNFKQFYSRDFGMCCESLIALGYKEKVRETLIYTMDIFEKHGTITTHLTPNGIPVNFPSDTPESAAYMLHSLIMLEKETRDKTLISKYKNFFSVIAKKIYDEEIDKETGLLRKDKYFSSMKDYSLRQSDCYNNCLLAMFAADLKKVGIKSELTKYNYKEQIAKHFLRKDGSNKAYFIEDLSGDDIVSGDANTFPFWTGLFKDKSLQRKVFAKLKEKKLDNPWPLKYTTKEDVPKKFHVANLLTNGYESDTIWIHLGLCYMKTLVDFDEKSLKKGLDEYETLIKKHKTFYELYDPNGVVFKRVFYKSDEAMSWCSIFLELYLKKKEMKKR